MPRVSSEFSSNYLKAADLRGQSVELEMGDCVIEEVGPKKDRKMVLYFKGKDKGMVLNKTNATVLAEKYGDDSDDWFGKVIELYPDKTNFQGELVDCLRLRVPTAKGGNDEIPF